MAVAFPKGGAHENAKQNHTQSQSGKVILKGKSLWKWKVESVYCETNKMIKA